MCTILTDTLCLNVSRETEGNMKKSRKQNKYRQRSYTPYRKMLRDTGRRLDRTEKQNILYESLDSHKYNLNRFIYRDALRTRGVITYPSRVSRMVKQTIRDEYRRRICKERQDKKKVLFSTRKAGKGISGPRNKWYSIKSFVRC